MTSPVSSTAFQGIAQPQQVFASGLSAELVLCLAFTCSNEHGCFTVAFLVISHRLGNVFCVLFLSPAPCKWTQKLKKYISLIYSIETIIYISYNFVYP